MRGRVLVLAWRRVHPCLQLQAHLDQVAGFDRVEGWTKWCVVMRGEVGGDEQRTGEGMDCDHRRRKPWFGGGEGSPWRPLPRVGGCNTFRISTADEHELGPATLLMLILFAFAFSPLGCTVQ